MRCDLHTHTNFTDGFHSPDFVVKCAKQNGLKAIAITDHNCLDALPLAKKTAEKEKIELITGVEINCEATEILAYFFDTTYEPLLKILEENKKSINDVMVQKIYWLRDNGYNIEIDDVLKFTGPTKNLMATHLALELKRKGYAKDLPDAFANIIKKINAGYKPKRISTKKIISEIKSAGGVAVLPHPWYLPLSLRNDFENYISKLSGYGLVGVETTGPHEIKHEKFLENCKEITKRLDLIETGGSDFHGIEYFPENIIGKYTVDYSIIKKLREKII